MALPGLLSAAYEATGAFKPDDKSALPAGATGSGSVLRIPHWDENPELWERIIIAGAQWPGSALVSGDGYKRRTDRKRAAGQHGETTTDLGQEAADIDVTVEIWTAEQLANFHLLVKKVLAPARKQVKEEVTVPYFPGYMDAGGTPTTTIKKTITKTVADDGPGPVSIYYPALALFGITKVQVLSIGLPTPKSRDVWVVKMKCRQYIANKGAKVTTNEKTTDNYSKRLGGNAFEKGPASVAANRPSVTTTAPGYVPGGGRTGGRGATGIW